MVLENERTSKGIEALKRWRESGETKTPEQYEALNRNSRSRAIDAFTDECNGFAREACTSTYCSLHKFCKYGKLSGLQPDLWWTQPKNTWRYFIRGDKLPKSIHSMLLPLRYIGPLRAIAQLAHSVFHGD